MTMTALQWGFEVGLALLLAATLWYAIRLERRLGVLRRDNAALEALVAGFNDATTRAEASTARLRAAAEGAGRQISDQVEGAGRLRDDLLFLLERGEQLADRLDTVVREARGMVSDRAPARAAMPQMPNPPAAEPEAPRVRSQAERDLLQALRAAR
ncbi:DUF6468 domain-containing protein [Elioraea rosea]|uniref:DUF6468 domain-containing protein n=1 Tax=Elioraea rosea TaxID=2492390 RepID=UPI001315175F|nr:DUF6468 domain-containing protein [Elioraea rosea]